MSSKPTFLTNRDGARVATASTLHLDYLRDARWIKPRRAGDRYRLLQPRRLQPARRLSSTIPAGPPSAWRRARPGPERQMRKPTRVSQPARRRPSSFGARSKDMLTTSSRTAICLASLSRLQRGRPPDRWLRSDEGRGAPAERSFLHGKAFIVTTTTSRRDRRLVQLHLCRALPNLELNLGQYQPHVVEKVRRLVRRALGRVEPTTSRRSTRPAMTPTPVADLPADALGALRRRDEAEADSASGASTSPPSSGTGCGGPSESLKSAAGS